MKISKLKKYFWVINLILFLSFPLPAFSFSSEELNQQKSIIQRSINVQPNNYIFQRNPQENEANGNLFIPESPEPLKNYLLNTGDALRINILSDDFNFENISNVSPEGKIFIPKIGEFFVTGLSTDKLKEKIRNKLSTKIKNPDVSVLLFRVRTLKVFLTGNAIKPGTFTVEYGTRLLDFLRRNDGLTENGSVRNIEIESVYKEKKIYDLYNFVYKGSLENNPILKAGDKIYIPFISKRLVVAGNALRPGIYEFKENDNPLDIIKLSGGFTNASATDKVFVWKNGMNSFSDEPSIIDLNSVISVKFNDGDIIFIPSLKQSQEEFFVHTYGQVVKSGSLQYREGMKLSDYLKLSGGFTPVADLENVKITRIKNNHGKTDTKIFIVNANDILYNGNTGKDMLMEANDVIFVPEKFFIIRNFGDITGLVLSTLGIVSLVLSFSK